MIIITSLLLISLVVVISVKPEVRIVYLYQGSGRAVVSSLSLETKLFINKWQDHLDERLRNDPTWPFNATVELLDTQSSVQYTNNLLYQRVYNSSLPPVTVVGGPESKYYSLLVAEWCHHHKIPYVSYNSGKLTYPREEVFNTSFFVSPANIFQYLEVINAYRKVGVKSVVSVSMASLPPGVPMPYNTETCSGAGSYAATMGIDFLADITVTWKTTKDELLEVIRNIRDEHNPDAIMWCDVYSAVSYFKEKQPVALFKEVNYLPKALTVLDNLDGPDVDDYKAEGLFLYVTQGIFSIPKVKGSDYTEGNTPYSSLWRTKKSINNVNEDLNFGSTSDAPSSTTLINEWYQSVRNTNIGRWQLSLWATFDVIEAGAYLAAVTSKDISNGEVTATGMYRALQKMHVNTPLGPVRFDENGDNKAYVSLVLQSQSTDTSTTADIVYPLRFATSDAKIIYPMPTWDERIYTWKLIDENNVRVSMIVAYICSAIIVLIAITVIIFRRSPEIRMLHYLHLVFICLSGLAVIWSLVFLWQKDNNETQCNSFIWAVFLPASLMIQLVNVKAYRLSVFLVASASGRRPKSFTHMRVVRITLLLLCFTVAILGAVTILGEPVRTKHVYDEYRQKFDEYRCEFQTVGNALMYLLVLFHIMVSILCVIAVRNGMEDFRDGLIIKESFLLLYISLAVAYIIQMLDISSSAAYLYRTCILSVGVTTFIFRMLMSRVVKFWIPKSLRVSLGRIHLVYVQPVYQTINLGSSTFGSAAVHDMSSKGSTVSPSGKEDNDSPTYAKEMPKDDNLKSMVDVLNNPRRKKYLDEVAKKSLTTENIVFLSKMIEFENDWKEELIKTTGMASNHMKPRAQEIYEVHIKACSNEEVNVSSSCRKAIEKMFTEWSENAPVLSVEDAEMIISNDKSKKIKIFEKANKEIMIMTYQNLWSKFTVAEATGMALEGEKTEQEEKRRSEDGVAQGFTAIDDNTPAAEDQV